jgi:glycosyltransferase involved in cell wall biosynthesis
MTPRRVLYLDTRFEHQAGGDKNRSRFLWQVLRGTFSAEFGLIDTGGASAPSNGTIDEFPPAITLRTKRSPWWQSASVFSFDQTELDRFRNHLLSHRYDLIVARFHSPYSLCRAAAKQSGETAIMVDLDMVSSRLVGLTWKQAPSIRNRWFFLEKIKLQRFEQQLLRQPWLISFSNPVELADLRHHAAPNPPACRFFELPNVMPQDRPLERQPTDAMILFFGSLNSAANLDGFKFLMELLPLVDADLKRHQVKIHVAGKNPPPWFAQSIQNSGTDRVVLLGAVDSMAQTIANSRFVVLPLRVASGTRTRILEAAAQQRAVVTTPIGAEGIDVGDAARVHKSPADLALAIRDLLDHPEAAEDLGRQLATRCRARYSHERVAADLSNELDLFLKQKKGGHP